MKNVPKRIIRRTEENPENADFQKMKMALELCRESDDDLWRQLISYHLEGMSILNGKEGSRIKKEIRRKLNHEI